MKMPLIIALMLLPSTIVAQKSINEARRDYVSAKEAALDKCRAAYQAEIDRAKGNGDEELAESLRREWNSFHNLEELRNRWSLGEIIAEYEYRVRDARKGFSARKSAIVIEAEEWVKEKIKGVRVEFDVMIRDVEKLANGHYAILSGSVLSSLRIRTPHKIEIRMSDRIARQITSSSKLRVEAGVEIRGFNDEKRERFWISYGGTYQIVLKDVKYRVFK